MRVFLLPIALAVVSAIGLTVALLGDGWHDVAAWIAIGVPVAAVAWAMLVRRV